MSVIADTFNRANQTGLGTSSDGWLWSAAITGTAPNIVSNQGAAETTGGVGARVRAETDLGSVDHWAEVAFVAASGTLASDVLGPCIRYSAAADTCYALLYRSDGGTARIFKVVAGTATVLATLSSTTALSAGDVVRLEVVGTALTARRNGASILTVTDSAISTGTRTGIHVQSSALASLTFDNFQANDFLGQNDTGSGTDGGESVASTVTDSDTGSGADAGESIASTLSDTETGSAADDALVTITVSDADTASGADDASVAGTASDSETGSSAEAAAIAATLADDEPAVSLEEEAIAATLTDDDTGTAVEDEIGLSYAPVTDDDAATGADAGEAVAAGILNNEPATATDDATMILAVTDSDAATAVEFGDAEPDVLPSNVLIDSNAIDNPSGLRMSHARVYFSTSYTLGGEPLTAHDVDLRLIHFATVLPRGSGYDVQWVAGKLRVYGPDGNEVDPGTDLSTLVVDVVAFQLESATWLA